LKLLRVSEYPSVVAFVPFVKSNSAAAFRSRKTGASDRSELLDRYAWWVAAELRSAEESDQTSVDGATVVTKVFNGVNGWPCPSARPPATKNASAAWDALRVVFLERLVEPDPVPLRQPETIATSMPDEDGPQPAKLIGAAEGFETFVTPGLLQHLVTLSC
jgi:hypothetical protein